MLVTRLIPAAANADGRDIVSGPTCVTGVYRDGLDTTVTTQARPVVSPEGTSPANFLEWSNAAGGAGVVYDGANPAGRFRWTMMIHENQDLRLEWQGAGAGIAVVGVIVEHDPRLYRDDRPKGKKD